MQDEERRRLARELHDSAGQLLAALSMKLTPLESEASTTRSHSAKAIEESLGLVDELSRELRTVSHLLHPPLLDEVGLSSALRLYLEGFAERSKIKVDLDFPDDFGRLSAGSGNRYFPDGAGMPHQHSPAFGKRGSQGSHFPSPTAMFAWKWRTKARAYRREGDLSMESAGMAGVGIRGMRERIRQLGGALEINSDGRGTLIVAHLPVGSTTSTAIA